MKEMKSKKIPDIKTIKKRLKNALDKYGSYDEGMDTLIETTAISMQALYEIAQERSINPKPLLIEKSRENNDKTVPNPLYKMQIEQIELIRKLLRELRLTLATVEGGCEADELNEIYDEVNNLH